MEVRRGEKETGEKEASKEKERAGKGKKRMAGEEEKISGRQAVEEIVTEACR